MELPKSDTDGPKVDPAVLRALRTLDPNLVVTWHRWAIDPLTGQKIIVTDPKTDPMTGDTPEKGPIYAPAFHLWRRDDLSSHYFWVTCSPEFNHLNVKKLEADLARVMDPQDIPRLLRLRDETHREHRLKSGKDDVGALIRANWTKIKRSFEGDDKDTRGAKLISGPGLTKRSTPGDVPLTPKEAGWESPDRKSN